MSTILIVDDDPVGRDLLHALLNDKGYTLAFAENGIEAITRAREIQPDVILLDVVMPGMDGFEVCRKLRADPILAEVPIILVTGLSDRESFLEGLNAGADDFVSKPFDAIELQTRVAAIVRLNRYRRLLDERAKFEKLVELSPDGILLLDADGRILIANPAVNRMLKAPYDNFLLGKTVQSISPQQHRDQVDAFLTKILTDSNSLHRCELYFLRTDDTLLPVEISGGYISWQGQPSVQILIRDIRERKEAEAEIRRIHEELTIACDTSLEGWSRALELRDQETEGHSQRVVEMTLTLAKALGVPDDELVHIRRGALLHDIGKMGIPDSILLKAGPLTEEEWAIMRKHPVYAFEMLYPIAYLRPALDIPHYHHERWDGTGYPCGLKGEEIPLAARIFAVVDVWDALCSDRPYSKKWSLEEAQDYIRSLAGTQLDPKIVEVFLALDPVYPCQREKQEIHDDNSPSGK